MSPSSLSLGCHFWPQLFQFLVAGCSTVADRCSALLHLFRVRRKIRRVDAPPLTWGEVVQESAQRLVLATGNSWEVRAISPRYLWDNLNRRYCLTDSPALKGTRTPWITAVNYSPLVPPTDMFCLYTHREVSVTRSAYCKNLLILVLIFFEQFNSM